jgi:gamma-glutamyltranspeptidase/glutathione hydrolase
MPFDHPSTTHFTIVDKEGNVAAVTSSIEFAFGSELMVDGFLLNNQLTDFSAIPTKDGKPVANAAAPGKRPLSAMAPTIVLDKDGHLVMAIGSPGGARIIAYVVKAIIASLDWNLPMQEAVDLPNLANLNGKTEIEDGPGAPALKAALEARGHDVVVSPMMRSGLYGFRVVPGGYDGGADRHRGGEVIGEKPLSRWPHLKMPPL